MATAAGRRHGCRVTTAADAHCAEGNGVIPTKLGCKRVVAARSTPNTPRAERTRRSTPKRNTPNNAIPINPVVAACCTNRLCASTKRPNKQPSHPGRRYAPVASSKRPGPEPNSGWSMADAKPTPGIEPRASLLARWHPGVRCPRAHERGRKSDTGHAGQNDDGGAADIARSGNPGRLPAKQTLATARQLHSTARRAPRRAATNGVRSLDHRSARRRPP
jgi:hypothetical protein